MTSVCLTVRPSVCLTGDTQDSQQQVNSRERYGDTQDPSNRLTAGSATGTPRTPATGQVNSRGCYGDTPGPQQQDRLTAGSATGTPRTPATGQVNSRYSAETTARLRGPNLLPAFVLSILFLPRAGGGRALLVKAEPHKSTEEEGGEPFYTYRLISGVGGGPNEEVRPEYPRS
ncbi:hypothetical protein CRUP_024265 [Coryphaenoides rupestris]|nr:hypothetical protein CRUP_024265 [Coryphaenoides rupestris]